jgi:hypothetical protein
LEILTSVFKLCTRDTTRFAPNNSVLLVLLWAKLDNCHWEKIVKIIHYKILFFKSKSKDKALKLLKKRMP